MKSLFTLLAAFVALQAQSQTEKWDLKRCVEYATSHNISVKQADIQARIAAVQAKQSKLAVYPSVSGSSGLGMRFGRSIDPTTNAFSTTQFLYQNFGLSGGMQLYNYGSLKNAATVADLNAKAALTDVDKIANDISLSVANFYLTVLAAAEQVKITQVQIGQTLTQLEITKKRVDAGALPELNLAEIQVQLASDSSNYIAAYTGYEQNILNLQGLLNLDPAVPFEVATPNISTIPIPSFAELQPAMVYEMALGTQPLQKSNAIRLEAAKKSVLVAKAQQYPTLSVGGNLASNFSNSFKKTTGASFLGYGPGVPGYDSRVSIAGQDYYVQSPMYKINQTNRNISEIWDGWSKQLSNNFGQNLGFNLSIPIFSAGQAKASYQRANLNVKNVELQKEQADITLKQNIYTSYNNATAALQKLNASTKAVETAQKAYDFASKRYEVGLLSSLDLITNQNNLLRAKVQQLSNQYDYIFKMKVLEFYKGQGIKF
jgi:outer membrane protein